MRLTRVFVVLFLVVLAASCSASELQDYVNAPDPSYNWHKASTVQSTFGTVYTLKMTSQTWHSIPWTHDVEVVIPNKCNTPKTAVLLITSGSSASAQTQIAGLVAGNTGCPVIVLYGIPNQPLFDGLTEDDLIAETFVRSTSTGDFTWPALLPMTKSAVKAMDAVQDFAKNELKSPITSFIVTGASKRGWTTWLTAAVAPNRVKAIIPIVYDNLNLKKQMAHQIESWGAYSEMIAPYSSRNVQEQLFSAKGSRLSSIVDPWEYRNIIKMPKLIINGTNDPYWTLGSLNLYWNDLEGPKYVLYVQNGSHFLVDGGPDALLKIIGAISSFTRAVATDKPLPKINWKYTSMAEKQILKVDAKTPGTQVSLWTATSDTRDFRHSKWTSSLMASSKNGYVVNIDNPKSGYKAAFAEVNTPVSDGTCAFCTQVRILNAKGMVE